MYYIMSVDNMSVNKYKNVFTVLNGTDMTQHWGRTVISYIKSMYYNKMFVNNMSVNNMYVCMKLFSQCGMVLTGRSTGVGP